jgi:hypothetical protein
VVQRDEKVKAKKPPKGTEAKAKKGRGSVEEQVEQLRATIRELAAGEGPVLVGPYYGEVGFELLYWLPMIRWAVREFPALEGRLVVVSRGGSGYWWRSSFECRYVDILSLYPPDEYLGEVKGAFKQRRPSESDYAILGRINEQLGTENAQVLHPKVMYEFYYQACKSTQSVFVDAVKETIDGLEGLAAIYEPIPPPEPDAELAELLPEEYVAVRFYYRDSFPDAPDNHAFCRRVIETVAGRIPVVLLNNGMELDDHRDFAPEAGSGPGGIIRIDHLMTPENNLYVQTCALGRARGFIGVYGGLSYLPPFLGRSSIAFCSTLETIRPWHTALAQRVFTTAEYGSLMIPHTSDEALLELFGA